MTTYLSKAELLHNLTALHERTVTSKLLGGSVCIREVNARARLAANEAAMAENPDRPDQSLYWAMLIHEAVIDPETKERLFTLDEALTICDGRDLAVQELVSHITTLAALGPRAMFRRRPSADGAQRDAHAGAEAPGDAAGADADRGSGDDDGGAALPDGKGDSDGDGAERVA